MTTISPQAHALWDQAIAAPTVGQRLRFAHRALHMALDLKYIDSSIDREGAHDAPCPESGSPLWDVCANGIYPEDFYSGQGLRYYGTGDSRKDAAAYDQITNLSGCPNKSVTVYRAVSKGAERKINPGDWVTTVRSYADDHGKNSLNGEFDVVQKTVCARDLFTAGDSFLEWGYHPQPRMPSLGVGWKAKSLEAVVFNNQRCRAASVDQQAFRVINMLMFIESPDEQVSLQLLSKKLGIDDARVAAIALAGEIEAGQVWKRAIAPHYPSVESLLDNCPDALDLLQVRAGALLENPVVMQLALKHELYFYATEHRHTDGSWSISHTLLPGAPEPQLNATPDSTAPAHAQDIEFAPH